MFKRLPINNPLSKPKIKQFRFQIRSMKLVKRNQQKWRILIQLKFKTIPSWIKNSDVRDVYLHVETNSKKMIHACNAQLYNWLSSWTIVPMTKNGRQNREATLYLTSGTQRQESRSKKINHLSFFYSDNYYHTFSLI